MIDASGRCSPPTIELDAPFAARVWFDGRAHVVDLVGEFDADNGRAAIRACTLPGHVHVVVAMAKVTFMDCAGYGALEAAQSILRERGGSLSLTDPVGEPLRLLSLLDQLADDLTLKWFASEPLLVVAPR